MRRFHVVVLLAFVLIVVTGVAVFAGVRALDPKIKTITMEVDGSSIDLIRVDGVGTNHAVVENIVISPGGREATQYLPGRQRVDPIKIRYWAGVDDGLVYDWRMAAEQGSNYRKNAAIVFYDQSGSEFRRFCLDDAWPTDWKITNSRRDKRVQEVATIQAGGLQEC